MDRSIVSSQHEDGRHPLVALSFLPEVRLSSAKPPELSGPRPAGCPVNSVTYRTLLRLQSILWVLVLNLLV